METDLVELLRSGDEQAFALLIARHQPSLLRIAGAILGNRALAEEVVQESWISALQHLPEFEQRASFKTWLTTIVIRRAKNVATREGRSTSLEDLTQGPSVPPDRFTDDGWSWVKPPICWSADQPEQFLRQRQAREAFEKALESLPEAQRAVVTLRDVEGMSSNEVCEVLSLSAANQRILLHRGRSRLRALMEAYSDGI